MFLDYIISDEKFSDIDIMVYIDEDCFIIDEKALLELIEYSIINEYDCVGLPDGGVVPTRKHNPLSINQFFCILNLKEIRKKYNKDDVANTVYTEDLNRITPFNLIKHEYAYDDFEPYYKLFFWMLKLGFKFLYLDGRSYEDDLTTTILKNHNNIEFAYHTWYSRLWKNKFHHERITKIIDHCRKNIKEL